MARPRPHPCPLLRSSSWAEPTLVKGLGRPQGHAWMNRGPKGESSPSIQREGKGARIRLAGNPRLFSSTTGGGWKGIRWLQNVDSKGQEGKCGNGTMNIVFE
eukprot:scaffold48_cov394-Pavlova_lutheri.AAC.6